MSGEAAVADMVATISHKDCLCSDFLLNLEEVVLDNCEKVSEEISSQRGMQDSSNAIQAFTLIIKNRAEAQSFLSIATTSVPDAFLLALKDLTDKTWEEKNKSPAIGEIAARAFLAEVAFTVADLENAQSSWVILKRGARLAETWSNWQMWVHRTQNGFSFESRKLAGIVGLRSASAGGIERARVQGGGIASERRAWKVRADKLRVDLSKAAKAKLIEEALKKENPSSTKKWQTIQRYI
jgi:hypothetical protein